MEKEKDTHQIEVDFAYEAERHDKHAAIDISAGKRRVDGVRPRSKDCVDVMTFDFQQNLEMPMLCHDDTFYLCQMWMYNFGINDCARGRGYMYLYGETTTRRGSSEVVTCMATFLREHRTGAR